MNPTHCTQCDGYGTVKSWFGKSTCVTCEGKGWYEEKSIISSVFSVTGRLLITLIALGGLWILIIGYIALTLSVESQDLYALEARGQAVLVGIFLSVCLVFVLWRKHFQDFKDWIGW